MLMRPRLLDDLHESNYYSLYDVKKIDGTFLFMDTVPVKKIPFHWKVFDSEITENIDPDEWMGGMIDGELIEQIDLQKHVWRGLCITVECPKVIFTHC